MISDELLEALAKDDGQVQTFSRSRFDELCKQYHVADQVRPLLWDLSYQAGASYGALATAKNVNQGWKDAAERAAISKVILKP